LEADTDMLKKELILLKNGGGGGGGSGSGAVSASSTSIPSALIAELDALKRDMAMIKLAGFGKGERGDRGDKGDKGDKGDPGPMTYIAMPANASLPVVAPAPVPVPQAP
jgi:hypothetical protein